MTALIDAEKNGLIDRDARAASLVRLKRLPAAHAAMPPPEKPALPPKKSAAKP